MGDMKPLTQFVSDFTQLVDSMGCPQTPQQERELLTKGQPLLSKLIASDHWLADDFRLSHSSRYQQYLLYCDPLERFSLVSFVWAAGQKTPIHDHCVWGMIGVLQGIEICQEYHVDEQSQQLLETKQHSLQVGEIDWVSPYLGDIHRVSNGLEQGDSISIHLYGSNIGKTERHIYQPNQSDQGYKMQAFISGYDNSMLPNIWC